MFWFSQIGCLLTEFSRLPRSFYGKLINSWLAGRLVAAPAALRLATNDVYLEKHFCWTIKIVCWAYYALKEVKAVEFTYIKNLDSKAILAFGRKLPPKKRTIWILENQPKRVAFSQWQLISWEAWWWSMIVEHGRGLHNVERTGESHLIHSILSREIIWGFLFALCVYVADSTKSWQFIIRPLNPSFWFNGMSNGYCEAISNSKKAE